MDNSSRDVIAPVGQQTHQSLQGLFHEKSVGETHQLLENTFKQYYFTAGYIEASPLPLISDRDPSVLFTGASISALKDMLISGKYPEGAPGVYLAQECLRTNALKYAFNNDWIPYGQIYFKMVANLSRPGRFSEVVREAIDFTQNHIGVDPSRMRIRSTKSFKLLDQVDDLAGVEVEYDTRPPEYYQWNYGIEGVHGEGLTICICNPSTGKWFDVGNVVVIYDSTGRELGIEFGYGYEFFLTAVLGVDQALKLSRAFEFFEFTPGLPQKYYSTIEAIAMMKAAGARVGGKKVDHIYKQYLKSLEFMGSTLGKDINEIISELAAFMGYVYNVEFDIIAEEQFIQEHRARKIALSGIIKRIGAYLWAVHKDRKPKEHIQDPAGLINNYLTANGIDPLEVESQLQRLQRFNIF